MSDSSHKRGDLKTRITAAAATIFAGLAGAAFLDSLRQRARAMESENCAKILVLAALEDGTYEICPACDGEGGGCTYCWDTRIVAEHEHEEWSGD